MALLGNTVFGVGCIPKPVRRGKIAFIRGQKVARSTEAANVGVNGTKTVIILIEIGVNRQS